MDELDNQVSTRTRNARILLVDDEPKLRNSLANGMRLEQWVVVAAANGAEAMRSLDSEPFDLVVLDWMLPDADGVEIMQQIRTRWPDVPVVMITARNGRTDRAWALEHGASDFIVKPFAFVDLVARCRKLLDLS